MGFWFILGQIIVLLVRVSVGFALVALAARLVQLAGYDYSEGRDPTMRGAIGGLSALVGLMFLMSGWFMRVLAVGRTWSGRMLNVIVFLGILGWLAFAALMMRYETLGAAREAAELRLPWVQSAAGVFAALYAVCFIVPGMAYAPFRREEAAQKYRYGAPMPRGWAPGFVTLDDDENWGWWRSALQVPTLLLIGTGVYGMVKAPDHWLSAPWVLQASARYWMVVAGAAAVLSILAFSRLKPSSMQAWLGPQGSRKSVLLALLVAVLAYLTTPALTVGLPSLVHLAMAKTEVREEVHVVAVGQVVWRPSCPRSLRVTGPEGLVAPICHLPEAYWPNAKPGDMLALSGKRSALGLKFDTAELAATP